MDPSTIARLDDMGAHLVRCGMDKAAIDPGWQTDPCPKGLAEMADLVGLIPGRSDWCVIDIDFPKGGSQPGLGERILQVESALGEPAHSTFTPSGGWHYWYKLAPDGPIVPNWKLTVGDVRCDNGYVVLWAPEGVCEAFEASKGHRHTRGELFRLLAPLRAASGHGEAPDGGRGRKEGDRNQGAFARARMAGERDVDPTGPVLKAYRDAVEGGLDPEEAIVATIRGLGYGARDRAERAEAVEGLSDIGRAVFEFREAEQAERLTRLDRAARDSYRRITASVRQDGKDPVVWMRNVAQVWERFGDPGVRELLGKELMDQVRSGIDWSADYGMRWLVPGWVPLHRLAFLYAMGGIGKSRLSVQLALAKALGLPFWLPGVHGIKLEPKAARVAFVTWEDDATDMHRMLAQAARALGVDDAEVEAVLSDGRFSFFDVGGIGPLWSPGADKHTSVVASVTDAGLWLRSLMDQFDMVFVDPIAGAYGSEENVRTLVRDFISWFDMAARESHCTLVMLGHSSKEHLVSGSTDWSNGVRCVLGAQWIETRDVVDEKTKRKGTTARALQLAAVKLNGAVRPRPVWLVPGPGECGWVVGSRKDSESAFPLDGSGGE